MGKEITSVCVDGDLLNIARDKGLNVSGILNEALKAMLDTDGENIFIKRKEIEKEITENETTLIKLKARTSQLQKSLNVLTKMEELEDNKKLQPEEYIFFTECKEKLKDNPGFIEGMVKRYRNEFLRDINQKLFMEKLDQLGEGE